MDILPAGPKWQITELEVDGYNVERKIELIWRDGLKVVESLFGNPIFAQNMSFDPLRVWSGAEMEYGEWFTSHDAYDIQVRVLHILFRVLKLTSHCSPPCPQAPRLYRSLLLQTRLL